ncbi:MAG: hypothetical protein CFE43_15675 [Burkholderiales bacterium PBB3]|nr:MAG: hypothetical protein CFE43_15675 [Burkholderiales bacterium PBB3]
MNNFFVKALGAISMVLTLGAGLCGTNAAAQGGTLTINAAWYGTEAKNVNKVGNKLVVDTLRSSVVNGVLMIPSNMSDVLGGDPFPGVPKTLAVQVVHNGKVLNLRQNEGSNFVYPGSYGVTYLPAPDAGNVNVQAAWYGLDGAPATEAAVNTIRKGMVNGYVYVPPDMNKFFGNDPAPNKAKLVAVNVQWQGKVYDLRQFEGKALTFPGVEGVDYLLVYSSVPDSAIRALFNPDFYYHKNPDVRDAMRMDQTWDHFINNGIKEGRDPNNSISFAAMGARYPLLATLYGDNYKKYLQHYIGMGGANGALKDSDASDTRWFDKGVFSDPRLALFDPEFYVRSNPSVCKDPTLVIPKTGSDQCGRASMDVPALMTHFLVKGSAAGLITNTIPMGAAKSANGKEVMRSGDWLGVNEKLVSRTGNKIAILQNDGNFAVYPANNGAQAGGGANLWSFQLLPGNINAGSLKAPPEGAFITMQGDGRLCVYKGTSPSKNLGVLYCVMPQAAVNNYFMRLQTDGNLVVNQGTSLFDAGYYVFDFITKKPGSPSFWDKAANGIKSAVGCSS